MFMPQLVGQSGVGRRRAWVRASVRQAGLGESLRRFTLDDDSEPGNNDFSTNRDLEINLVSCLGWNRDPDPEKQPSSSHPAPPPTHLDLFEGVVEGG